MNEPYRTRPATMKDHFSQLIQSREKFPVRFDNAWDWIGFSRKDSAKRTLVDNFTKDVDYQSLHFNVDNQKGGQNKEYISLTIDCFKTFCMLANTEQGKKVRRYYIEIEKEYLKQKETALAIPDFKNPAEAARAWADQYEKREIAETKLLEAQPKVDFVNTLSPCKGSQGIGQFAKSVNSGQNRMFAWLREKKYIIPGKTVPFQKWIDQGLFEVTQGIKNERVWAVSQITPKGIARIGEEFVQSQKK